MNLILWQMVGGITGLIVGSILVLLHARWEDRKHARECLRMFDAKVAELNAQRAAFDRQLEQIRSRPGRAEP